MDLCFVVDDDYREFLSEFAPEKIKNMQENWIGKVEGFNIKFFIKSFNEKRY